jgi:hypothetical protein
MARLARERLEAILEDERRWRYAVLALALLAVVVRLGLVAVTGGGNDLRIYFNFAHLAIDGTNPYTDDLPAGFPLPERLGDNLPGELLLFGGVLKLHDSPDSIRVLFALADAGVIALVGLAYPRPRPWRAAFVVFYALNPLVLGSWTATSEDKTLLFLLIAGVLLALELGRVGWAWAGSAVLGGLKGVGVFFAPPLALHTLRTRGWRAAAWMLAAFAAFLVVAHLPWYPEDLRVYERRADTITYRPPHHASLMLVPSELGFYDPAIVRVGTLLLLLAVYAAYVLRRIDVRESLVLASAATVVLMPDHSYTRCLLVALPFLLIMRLDTRRWAWLWGVSFVASVLIWLQQEQDRLGGYGSIPHMLASNAFVVLVIGLWLSDRRPRDEGTAARPAAVPAGASG